MSPGCDGYVNQEIRLPVVVFDICIKLLRGGDAAVLEDIQYVSLFGKGEKAFAFA